MTSDKKPDLIKLMDKQGYRFVGRNKHSAIKVCEWLRESLRGKRVCYKEQFYHRDDGVCSHRCVQMTPAVFWCTHNCEFCWRTGAFALPKDVKWDKPKEIVDEAVAEHRKILQGFKGYDKADKKKFSEAMRPLQFAISLTGEPTLYPYLPGLVKEIKSRGASVYIVSNGTNPEMIERLSKTEEAMPTKMYITLPAPDESVYKKTCHPLLKDGWQKIVESLSLLKKFRSSVVRLTLVKNMNMLNPEEYARLISEAQPNFIEVKAFMSIGSARERLPITSMPTHSEIRQFTEDILKYLKEYKIIGEKKDSRVVLSGRR